MLNWFWLVELVVAVTAYVMLDGFDLGVGVLSGVARSNELRDGMVASISPVWDGNGTWLVIAGTILFGAFPPVYSILLPALYIPLSAMLAGLIMRGVAIEFRHRAVCSRWVWDMLLFIGSLLAAFMQGVSVGAYAQGLPVEHLRYTGNGLEWSAAFPLLCGLGLVLGYMLLGSGWLVLKGEGRLQRFGRNTLGWLTPLTLLVLAAIFVATLFEHRAIEARWYAHPVLDVLPLLCIAAFACAPVAARRASLSPYVLTVTGCVLLLLMLAASYLPYIVPFQVTLSAAAAPKASQTFMFWGAGLFILPLIVLYTCVAYSVFRGKVSSDHTYH
ncbi:cytochrome d ubiquinol oxidase subunit II (plasmid) [Cupriavidus sp. KK10]|jgi:cytochrome d ubiquinol oxidase subunit II|uniref:cytochrome d ubiquinol oxidase subunit II n=1 Tax=Cupriavidus sp. KK10 TaxID=1478019 RepID=UPI001BA4FBF5|nr:cytochrome d ubiquinol oxidase subunit II [Cupriavidus sp. KK10]QUN32598.1 cytochrome d ubiquinol oxidase subunit II [Cupriavidus sp. KK10]